MGMTFAFRMTCVRVAVRGARWSGTRVRLDARSRDTRFDPHHVEWPLR
jgi:hypothetical protein